MLIKRNDSGIWEFEPSREEVNKLGQPLSLQLVLLSLLWIVGVIVVSSVDSIDMSSASHWKTVLATGIFSSGAISLLVLFRWHGKFCQFLAEAAYEDGLRRRTSEKERLDNKRLVRRRNYVNRIKNALEEKARSFLGQTLEVSHTPNDTVEGVCLDRFVLGSPSRHDSPGKFNETVVVSYCSLSNDPQRSVTIIVFDYNVEGQMFRETIFAESEIQECVAFLDSIYLKYVRTLETMGAPESKVRLLY